MSVLEVDDVTFSYAGSPAVENVSFSIPKGEFFGLVGPNGSGKTTLLKLLLGILRPDSGRIAVFGESVDDFNAGERIGYVPQQSTRRGRTMPLTVREVVAMGRYPHRPFGRFGGDDTAAIEEALRRVDITALADRRFSRLSGGQQQRVLLARAVAAEADLLVLDEPTVGVDADSRESFFDLLDRLNSQGLTTVLVDHDLQTVVEHADRIACLNRSLSYLGPAAKFDQSAPFVQPSVPASETRVGDPGPSTHAKHSTSQ